MNAKKLEKGLIEHCAPTLAGMKCASLFNYFHEGKQIVREELEEKDKLFQKLKKCKEVYQQVFCEGRGLLQMTVCT